MLEFKILGPFEVHDGEKVLDLGGPRQRAVLAVLVLAGARIVSLDRMVAELWGDEPPPRAVGTVQAYVSNLRRVLEPDRAARSPAQILASRAPGYVLNVPAEALDAARFEQLLASARSALDSGEPAMAHADVQRALGLWRGDPLPEFADMTFASSSVERLNELHTVALETALAAELALGRADIVAVEAENLLRRHPLREGVWEMLMLAFYRGGRQADSLRAFQRARQTLDEELGIDPGPALVRLERAVLDHDPSLDWQPPVALRATRAEERTPVPSPSDAAEDRSNSPLVGRRREIDTWRHALASDSGVRLALIRGEAGAGKSRLAEELVQLAEKDGNLVATARCSETAGVPPLWPWRQVVRSLVKAVSPSEVEHIASRSSADLARIVPDLFGPPSGPASVDDTDIDASRFQLCDSLSTFLDGLAMGRRIVVFIDDLQWSDALSLHMVQFLVRDRRVPGLLLVAAIRDGERGENAALDEVLAALVGEASVLHLPLDRFGPDDVRQLVVREAGLDPPDEVVDTIMKRTGGNAFFVSELTRLLASEGKLGDAASAQSRVRFPAELHAVMQRRVARLPADGLQMLTVAATIGDEFALDVLERASSLPLERLLDLVEVAVLTHIVVESSMPGTYRFAHALMRELLYEGLTRVRRARLHANVTAALESLGDGIYESNVSLLAYHSFHGAEAGTAAAAIGYNIEAARDAANQLSFDRETVYWRQALTCLDLSRSVDLAQRYDILMGLSRASRCAGDLLSAQQASRDAIDLVTRMDDDERMARAAVGLSRGWATSWGWRPYGSVDRDAIAQLERALASLGTEDSVLHAEVLGTLAVELYYAADHTRGVALSEAAVAMAERLGDPDLLATMLNMQYMAVHFVPRPEHRLAIAERMLALPAAGASESVGLTAREYRMACLIELGDPTGADAEYELALATATRLRRPADLVLQAWYRAMRALMSGRLEEAEHFGEEALYLHQRSALWGVLECYATQLFTLRREQGRLAELEPLLRDLLATSDFAGFREGTALLYLQLGRPDDARAVLGDRMTFPSMPRDWSWEFTSCVQAEVCAAIGDDASRRRLRDELAPLSDLCATIGTGICCWGPIAYFVGLLEESLGDTAAAAAHFDQAVELAIAAGATPWLERARQGQARLLADS